MAQDTTTGQDSGMDRIAQIDKELADLKAQRDLLAEASKTIEEYRAEVSRCWEIAQCLDSFNPTLPGAFRGNPSERIERHLKALKAPGFNDE